MADINLKGMGVALITPFKEDESVDYEALGKLVDYQVQNGTDYLVVLGTTAETPTLTEEEKKNIISLVVTRVRGRIPIVLGVGGNCTRSVVEKLKTDNFEGIDAILSPATPRLSPHPAPSRRQMRSPRHNLTHATAPRLHTQIGRAHV